MRYRIIKDRWDQKDFWVIGKRRWLPWPHWVLENVCFSESEAYSWLAYLRRRAEEEKQRRKYRRVVHVESIQYEAGRHRTRWL